ncbi:hypothetical protein ACJ6WF_19825 [Streptomyces sp. MMS24-I2-30]|uniref:hypothetical protein n=1 Tax=Streptomyces sp. MMS24-I2-30 TaxID=3351564 RepID=UPI0038969D73
MRPLYVPVRFAATVLAVSAAAGCVNVGADTARPGPSRSTGQQGGKAPDGGAPVPGAGAGYGGPAADGDRREDRDGAKLGESASAPETPSGRRSAPATPTGPRHTPKPGDPVPTEEQPPDPRTEEPTPPPTVEPPTSPTPPPTAEPSSSAHEDPSPQLVQREPAPAAGRPA